MPDGASQLFIDFEGADWNPRMMYPRLASQRGGAGKPGAHLEQVASTDCPLRMSQHGKMLITTVSILHRRCTVQSKFQVHLSRQSETQNGGL